MSSELLNTIEQADRQSELDNKIISEIDKLVREWKDLALEERCKRLNSMLFDIKFASSDIRPLCLSRLAEAKIITRKMAREKVEKYVEKELESTLEPLKKSDKGPQVVTSLNVPNLIDVVTDEAGEVLYLIKDQDRLEVVKRWEDNGVVYVPPKKEDLPFSLPRASEVLRWYQVDDDDNGCRLFTDIINYLKRFSYLSENLFLIVACKAFLTYIQDHPDIYYLPELLFWAVPERGKTRTGKALTYISFRGIHLVELRETTLFRFSQNMKSTLFFDIKDLWKKAERNNAEDILLLRFEKGAKASRVIYPDKGAFKDIVYYDIYGPTIIATNEAVHKILDTRCIPIIMPNRPGNYENPTPEKAQELKERLVAWRAKVINTPLPEVELIPGINGRLWDISEPLLRVCKLVSPMMVQSLTDGLLIIAGQKLEEKKSGMEWQIVSTLYELSPEEEVILEWSIKTSRVLEKLNEDRPEDRKLTSQYLGKKLKAMGIETRYVHGYSEILLNRSEFNLLLTQFGICIPPSVETLPNSTILKSIAVSTNFAGRESGRESATLYHSLPTLYLNQVVENKEVMSLVESGRVSTGAGKEKFFKELNMGYEELKDSLEEVPF